MIRPREATESERVAHLAGSEGYVIEDAGRVVACIGWCVLNNEFFIHSLVSEAGGWHVAALAQACRKRAKAMGFSWAIFHIKHPYTSLADHIDGERVRLDFALVSMKV